MLSVVSSLFAVIFLFLASYTEHTAHDVPLAQYHMLWAIFFIINAIYVKDDK